MKARLSKYIAVAGATCLALALLLPQAVFGDEEMDHQAFARKENFFVVDAKEEQLLDTYVNPGAAIEEFSRAHPYFISLAQEHGLPELSVQSAEEYKAFAFEQELNLLSDDFGGIVAFLDILENEVENLSIEARFAEIEALVEAGNLAAEEADLEKASLLPMDEGFNQPILPSTFNSGINLAAANAYASRYATSPNAAEYGYEIKWGTGVDCTNFASQILHAGGVGMVSTGNVNTGWWYKSYTQRSTSWIQAATFARYMGTGYNINFWTTFKNNVRAGDFIGFDSGGDGAVDHIGYVTEKSGGLIKIAQHSDDYHKWDNETGWASIGANGGRYYRIRR